MGFADSLPKFDVVRVVAFITLILGAYRSHKIFLF